MILVFGKNGQVAQALQSELKEWPTEFLSSSEADFLKSRSVVEILNQKKPKIVINASAYTMVDKAESEKEIAQQVNAIAVGEIAQWCAQYKVPLIHFSTDYVFDGSGTEPMNERTQTSPVNFYGQSKLAGEVLIQRAGGPFYIFRVSWVYAPWGKNFPKTILRLAQEREEISIVNDQFGSPTDAREISAFVKLIIDSSGEKINLEPGIYHLSFKPYMTWYQMAELIVKEARNKGLPLKVKTIHPITTDKFPTPAKRPANSRLVTQSSKVQAFVDRVKSIAVEKGWGFLE